MKKKRALKIGDVGHCSGFGSTGINASEPRKCDDLGLARIVKIGSADGYIGVEFEGNRRLWIHEKQFRRVKLTLSTSDATEALQRWKALTVGIDAGEIGIETAFIAGFKARKKSDDELETRELKLLREIANDFIESCCECGGDTYSPQCDGPCREARYKLLCADEIRKKLFR